MDAFILSAVRTPIGKFLGELADVPATRLGAVAIAEAIKRANVRPAIGLPRVISPSTVKNESLQDLSVRVIVPLFHSLTVWLPLATRIRSRNSAKCK